MILKAILKDNRLYCPECKESKYQLTDDYKLVEIDGTKYTEFVARCMNGNCNNKFYFQSKITINEHTHYVFDRNKEIEIKDE